METIEKIQVEKLKTDIKKLSENQRILKNQRKTVKLQGERTMDPSEATWKHQANREKLRAMFAAYGLMRGMSFSQIESSHHEEGHPLNEIQPRIDKIISEYSKEEVSNLS